MTDNKENWLKEASYKLALLEAMDIFLVPDARSLKAFLKKPTLIIKMAYGDVPEHCQELLNDYENFKQKKDLIVTDETNLKLLIQSYEQGLTPDEAAVEIAKWCDTPEEAGKFVASPDVMPFILCLSLIFVLFAIAIRMYHVTVDRVNVQNEYENSSTIYKNMVNLYQNKGDFKVDTVRAIKEGVIPKNMPIIDDKIMNRWDGEVVILGNNINSFEVKYSHVIANDVCQGLLQKEKNIGWRSITVDEMKFDNYDKIKTIDIAKLCDKKDFVDITFKK